MARLSHQRGARLVLIDRDEPALTGLVGEVQCSDDDAPNQTAQQQRPLVSLCTA